MAKLREQYCDTKGLTHPVEHLLHSQEQRPSEEKLLKELLFILTHPSAQPQP